jgi:hypothetical protein
MDPKIRRARFIFISLSSPAGKGTPPYRDSLGFKLVSVLYFALPQRVFLERPGLRI